MPARTKLTADRLTMTVTTTPEGNVPITILVRYCRSTLDAWPDGGRWSNRGAAGGRAARPGNHFFTRRVQPAAMNKPSLPALAAIGFIGALAIWPDDAPGRLILGALWLAIIGLIFRLLFRVEEGYDRPIVHVRWDRLVVVAGIVVWYISERLHNGW